jgi:transcriptional regulator with XRE-family HTH domain
MRLLGSKLKKLCRTRGLRLADLLSSAGVSKTAYYHLLYKPSVLPNSIHALANALGVSPSEILEEISPQERMIQAVASRTDEIIAGNPTLNRENVRHTLLLLEESPIDRLRRALIRGRAIDPNQERTQVS